MNTEEKGQIAWLYLIADAHQRFSMTGATKENLHRIYSRILANTSPEHSDVINRGGLWEFCDDLITTAYEEAERIRDGKRRRSRRLDPGADSQVSDEDRSAMSYVIACYMLMGENAFWKVRKLEQKVKAVAPLGVTKSKMMEFVQEVARDMISTAFDRIPEDTKED